MKTFYKVQPLHTMNLNHLKTLFQTLTILGLLLQANPTQPTWAKPLHPNGQRCKDLGPLTDVTAWCGCTWGAVFVDGAPVAGAQVTLAASNRVITKTTVITNTESFATYDLHADAIGAKYGDVATATASYRGTTITRTLRLIPNIDGEQLLNFVMPQEPRWEKWADVGLSRGLVMSGTTLWAGTPSGPVMWDTTTGVSVTHHTGQISESVQALAIAPNGAVYVGTASGLSQFDGAVWTTQNTDLTPANVRAIAVAPNGDVWAGTYDEAHGGLSRFDGTHWQVQPDFNGGLPNLITALSFDVMGHLWVGTDGAGVSRWDGTAWQTFRTSDGLASNTVTAIATEPTAVWIGTLSYITPGGTFGGVSRYDIASQTWTTYTQANWLASDDVTSLTIDVSGRKWFGTSNSGISRFDNLNWRAFTAADGLGANGIRALAAGPAGSLWAGTNARIDRWLPGVPGTAPVVS